MRTGIRVTLLVCVLGAAWVRADDSPTGLPSKLVQSWLGVPLEGTEAMTLIDQYTRVPPKTAADRSGALTEIAKAVLRGMDVDAMTRRSASRVTVATGLFGGDAGSESAVGLQARVLLEMERELKQTSDAVTARSLARAAIILGAQDRLHGARMFPRLVREGSAVLASAELTAEADAGVRNLAQRIDAAMGENVPYLRSCSKTLIALIKGRDDPATWSEAGKQFLKSFEAGMSKSADRLDLQWEYLAEAWRAVCLARASGQTGFVDEMASILEKLRAQTNDAVLLEWIGQVLTIPGGVPKGPVMKYIDNPNDMKRGKPD